MIEVMALAGGIKAVSAAISSAVKAGKDLSSLAPGLAKLRDLDAQVQLAETGKHKGLFGKLGSSESEAFAIVSAKAARDDAMNNLRELFQLYGKHGQWESFNAELGRIRKRKSDRLKEEAEKRRKLEIIVVSVVSGLLFFGGTAAMVYFAWEIGGNK